MSTIHHFTSLKQANLILLTDEKRLCQKSMKDNHNEIIFIRAPEDGLSFKWLLTGVIIVWQLMSYGAEAAILTVCSVDCDYTSIVAAIAPADQSDTISVREAVHTESAIMIDKDITIPGLTELPPTAQPKTPAPAFAVAPINAASFAPILKGAIAHRCL